MTDLANAGRRWLAGITLAVLASAPAFAATYNIKLFEAGIGTGTGSFNYTNPGTSAKTDLVTITTPPGLQTNASSGVGVQTFNRPVPPRLSVHVVKVDFNDGKTPPNHITGFYVEGLTGNLQTTPVVGLRPTGPCNLGMCFYRIRFMFTAAIPPANPATAMKTYAIDLLSTQNNRVIQANVVTGTYAVNNITTIPEPGSLALVLAAGAALTWVGFGRTRRDRAFARLKSG